MAVARDAFADGTSAQTCDECGNLFPLSQLKRDDAGFICRRCATRLVQQAADQRALIVKLIVVAFIATSATVGYFLLTRERPANPNAAPITSNNQIPPEGSTTDIPEDTPTVVPPQSTEIPPEVDPAKDANARPPTLPDSVPPVARVESLWTYNDVQRMASDPKGRVLVTYRREGSALDPNATHELMAWDVLTGQRLATLATDLRVESLAVSPDGKHALVAGRAKPVVEMRLINCHTGAVLKQEKVLEPWGGTGFSADGKTAWCLGPKEGIRYLQTATGSVQLFKGVDINSYHAAFSTALPIAALKCNSSSGQWIDVYQLTTRQRLHRLQPREPIGSDTLSPDGALVAMGFRRRIDLYDVRSGNVRRTLERTGYTNAPERLLISPDSRRVVEIPFGADGKQPVVYSLTGERTQTVNVSAADMLFLDEQTLLIAVEGGPLKKVLLK
ncbi:MAG: WD40 repeat domain-containing protein [Phycisphaeraceae bacterium]